MQTTAKTKHQLYLTLSEKISSLWTYDEHLLDADPETWQLTRTLDDWLVEYREDDRVGVEQYARNCERLRVIYENAVNAAQQQGAAL